jgi:hypothetical protein
VRRTLRFALPSLLLILVLSSCSLFSPDESGTADKKPSASASPTPTETAPPGTVSSTFFGVHDHEPIGEPSAAGWPDAPVGSFRAWDAGVTWRDIEVAPGEFDFSRLDAIVDTAEQNDSDVLLVMGQTPAFHAVDPASESFSGEGASSPPKMAAWRFYVRTLAERYADRPVILQVWNEANVDGFWRGTPQEMADLTAAAHDVIADVDPEALLVSPATVTRLSSQRKWIDDFYGTSVDGAPVADFLDVVSLQLYPVAEGTPETSLELLAAMRSVLESHGVDKPIWNTEINYGLTGLEVPPAPKKQQIMNAVATYLLNAANDEERVYCYGWDQQLNVGTLLVEPDGATVTPAGKAFRTVQEWMVGGRVTSCSQDEEETWTCDIDHPDGVRTVTWNPSSTVDVTLPEGAVGYQKAGGRLRDGQVGEQISVGQVPVMLQNG